MIYEQFHDIVTDNFRLHLFSFLTNFNALKLLIIKKK